MNQDDDIKRLKQARNDANNANTIYNAANLAEKSGHPLASGIGKGIKVADKLTGGKSTQKLGKAMTALNKASGLKGKAMQAASNKLGESGLGNRISSAMNKKNSAPTTNSTPISSRKHTQQDPKKNQGTINNKNIDDSSTMRDVQDQASDGGDASFKVDFKILYRGLIVCAACLPVLIFCNLFMSASQINIKSIGLGNADILGTEEAESKIDKKIDDEEGLDQNPTDEETNDRTNIGQLDFEINIDDDYKNFRDNKLKQSNIVQIAKTKGRKYNEATLEQLEDFYPSVGSLSEKYDEDLVYDFFFKMYNIFTTYKNEYNVELDLPLLMSTLMIQSEDMNEIFDSNLTKEEKSKTRISKLRMKSLYGYDTDLSSYRLSPDNSEHDMELLAQNMVSKGEDGNYKYDEEKYKEFLKEFLERKYFIEDVGTSSSSSSCSAESPFKKYDLTDEQLLTLTNFAAGKQDSLEGIAAEASLMANLFELKGSNSGKGANGLYNYVVKSNLFSNSSSFVPTSTEIETVKSVLVDGKRILPAYIDKRDCVFCNADGSGDIVSVTNDKKDVDLTNRENYKQFVSKIKNKDDSKYTFYSFLSDDSYLYGYTSEENRKDIGDLYYDFKTGEPSQCTNSVVGTDLSSAFVNLAVDQLKDPSNHTGDKYQNFGGIGTNDHWCAAFVTWNITNTSYNGAKLSDVIKINTISNTNVVSQYMDYFYYNKDKAPNIKFYYNDNCSNYKGKNNISGSYTPKEGDLIFFDWQACWAGNFPRAGASDYCGQDHIGIVQRVEDGNIITIEGNTSNAVGERNYSLNSCQVIGFGSWY